MNEPKPFGLYLLKKPDQDARVLKDLLQLLRTNSPGKSSSFSYIEAQTSLHPHLSLWENLQLEVGTTTWNDFQYILKPEWASLVKLIKQPELQASHAEVWEKFLVSFIKGIMTSSQNLLIDMNEELLSPFLIQLFKRSVLESTKEKTVYLATANTSLWLDCAHTLVDRKDYEFQIQALNSDHIKRNWAA